MNKYEAMFIVKPDLSEEDSKALYAVIKDAVAKNSGSVASGDVWSERRRLTFTLKKQQEGVYYLMKFSAPSDAITKLKYLYGLNESILRVLITRLDA
ncbi:MAG: 30S ribosomal protein S6 [Candidatus Omnitrophica bacterium]|jgi:small subunit ribosomal protein S6|nr:30S ribosomal protein S6 [Candidatus Omnitrophota bacterium]